MRPSIPLPAIPGSYVSGIVEAVAEDAGFTVGDEVFGMLRQRQRCLPVLTGWVLRAAGNRYRLREWE